jgi:glucose dehydrogenase
MVGRGPGDNLFSANEVARNAMTGDYQWHFQVIHHDLWDYDCPSPTVMFNAAVAGKMTKVGRAVSTSSTAPR